MGLSCAWKSCWSPVYIDAAVAHMKIPAQSTSYHPKNQLIPLINNIANTHSWLQDSYHAFLRYAFIRFSFFSYFLFVLYLLAGGFPGVFLVRYPATGDSLPVPTCRPIPSPSPGLSFYWLYQPVVYSLGTGSAREFKLPRRLEFKLPQQQVRPAQLSAAIPGRASPAYHHPSFEPWINYWSRLT